MKFTYISEILQDKRFKSILNDSIEEETHRRNNRLVVYESHGLKLRRNVFIHLDEHGLMNIGFLVGEFNLIEEGKSNLSANERHFIHLIVDEAIMKTIEYYKNSPLQRVKKMFNNMFCKTN